MQLKQFVHALTIKVKIIIIILHSLLLFLNDLIYFKIIKFKVINNSLYCSNCDSSCATG